VVSALADEGGRTILIWDGEGKPPKGNWISVLWRAYNDEGDTGSFSIPNLVEKQADALRGRILAWIYDLGEVRKRGASLVEQLALRPGFSYWWMTLLTEKSYLKPNRFVDAIKLLAFEDAANVETIETIVLASSDRLLAHTLRDWCRVSGFNFRWKRLQKEADPRPVTYRLYRLLPLPIQATVYLLRYVWQRWQLRSSWKPCALSAGGITVIDYLFHLGPAASSTGRYCSNYWTDLVDLFDKKKTIVQWIHHFVAHKEITTTRQARTLINRFNRANSEKQAHTIPDAALSCAVISATVRDYVRIVMKVVQLGSLRSHFVPTNSKINLWSLFAQEWRDSLFGPTAIFNCLQLNLFEKILRKLPVQGTGVYLQENQGWEAALIYAWTAAGHGRLVGVPHATIRYWDLRYFSDVRSYRRTGNYDLPLPDVIALNGPAAFVICRQAGIPDDRLVEVEALRYLHLIDVSRPALRSKNRPIRVLVLGDFLPSITRQQMLWLNDVAIMLPRQFQYIVRSHPMCPIDSKAYPNLVHEIADAPLKDLLGNCDVAYTGNVTSAAVDAYGAGIPVISMLDGRSFNLSPLRGLPGVIFVTNPAELAKAICRSLEKQAEKPEVLFCLDRQLPRWQQLLEPIKANLQH
jgi:surface carbohydrate biosynthesis protein (TIGR04326 family)